MTKADSQIHALVLDFDGLIVDTEAPIFEIWQAVFARHGQHLGLDDWQHALGTHGGFDPAARLAQLVGREIDAAALERATGEQHWQACRTLPLLPGVAQLLDDARRLGLGLAVASSSPKAWVETWLQHHGIRDRFTAVCVREDVARVKPAPDLFLLAAERLQVAARACLVFEDSPNGVRAALAAGMRCVAVPSAVTRPLALPPCDLVLETLAEISLPEILNRLTASTIGGNHTSGTKPPCVTNDAPRLRRASASTESAR